MLIRIIVDTVLFFDFAPLLRWFVMSSPSELISATLTPSACPMFRVLSAHLHTLQQVLAVPLFDLAWTQIASNLSQVNTEQIINLLDLIF